MPEIPRGIDIGLARQLYNEAIFHAMLTSPDTPLPVVSSPSTMEAFLRHNLGLSNVSEEKLIFHNILRPDMIVAVESFPVSPKYAKAFFYAHKGFELLFPHNFAPMHAYFPSSDQQPAFAVRGKIKGAHTRSPFGIEEPVSSWEGEPAYPFKDVLRACDEANIPLFLDGANNSNFVVGEDGGEYYVDRIFVDQIDNIPLNNISSLLDSQERFSDKGRVLNIFGRYNTIMQTP